MRSRNLQGAARAAGPSILATGIPYPATIFVAALLTDIEYARTADVMWTTMSSWLLLLGLIFATVAALAEAVRVFRGGSRSPLAVIHMLGNWLAVLLSMVNFVIHVRDGYSAVVPVGALLSATIVIVLMLTGWMGRSLGRGPGSEKV